MNRTLKIIALILVAGLLALAGVYTAGSVDRSAPAADGGLAPPPHPTGNAALVDNTRTLDQAGAVIEVTDLAIENNLVMFTIPENARAQEEKADQVTLSGIYAKDRNRARQCPALSSAAVSKEVQDYDMFSGRARVTARFETSAMAQQVYDKGCLLIEDRS